MNSIHKRNILIIAEGYEEKPYIDKLLSFPNINEMLIIFFLRLMQKETVTSLRDTNMNSSVITMIWF